MYIGRTSIIYDCCLSAGPGRGQSGASTAAGRLQPEERGRVRLPTRTGEANTKQIRTVS